MKKLFFVALGTLFSLATYAQAFTTFSIQKTDGSVEVLPAVGTKITFSSSVLSATNSNKNASIQLSTVDFMCFGNADEAISGIGDVIGNKVKIYSIDGTIQVVAPAGVSINVLNIAGHIISSQISTGYVQDIASELATGMYIVQIGSETFKTIVK